jgi:signal transduction histidine kinase
MKTPIRILHLEDDREDAALVASMLRGGEIDAVIEVVDTRSAFGEKIALGGFDLILADYQLPQFDGLEALAMARRLQPRIPLVIVSGVMGEEAAIDSMRSGATDYVLKSRLSRLVPAVRRALQEAAEREERRVLQEQFLQAQKMELFGRLAGGVAHDFNNILTIVMSNCGLMLASMAPSDPHHSLVDEIEQAGLRGAALTRQLLIFARHEARKPEILAIDEVLRTATPLLRRLVPESVQIAFNLDAGPARVEADRLHLEQAVMNLVVNARDAMPRGGSIVIETTVVDAQSVRVVVRDTGHGLTPEVRARIFEPFFSTKPSGTGTGLGLPTVQRIVGESGGSIAVESTPGEGASFIIDLPRYTGDLSPQRDTSSPQTLPRGSETILVVEDDPVVRHRAASMLARQGYTILTAGDGQEAVDLLTEQRNAVSLVFTDVIMPGMNAGAMAHRLRASHPRMRMLFTSGYTEQTIAPEGIVPGAVDFLPKPYGLDSLAGKVRATLDDTRAA